MEKLAEREEEFPQKQRYEIAGLRVVMTTYYSRMRKKAEAYLAKSQWNEEQADVEIFFEKEFYDDVNENSVQKLPPESWEYIYTGELFHHLILKHHGCMLHSSAVMVDGYAYLFSADSGTGKSTHVGLWKKYFGDRAVILNDDKPILRFVEGCWYVYGTPWSGKTDLNENRRGKLGAIVFLERAENNWIQKINAAKAIPLYMKQTVRKVNKEENMDLILKNMGQILTGTEVYQMGCNISEDAVIMAYNKIKRI